MKIYPDLMRAIKTHGIKPSTFRRENNAGLILSACGIMCLLMLFIASCAHAESINAGEYCDAIYVIEGGAKTKHPYGILAHYKHTTPRQACINTVNHAYKDWIKDSKNVWFENYLGNRYCPINSDTDDGKCQYWVNNLMSVMADNQIKEN